MDQASGDGWMLYNGDSVEVLKLLPENSVHLSIFSPPYGSLYVYSASDRDIGNCRNDEEFHAHFRFVVDGLLRATKPGRIVAVDCQNIPAMKERDGYIGLKDFRGDLIRAFQAAGFIYHAEFIIRKDPLIEATRTKALGLMHKQLTKDSTRCRAGLPQFLLCFRKPGENTEPVAHIDGLEYFVGENEPTSGVLAHERWRRYADPVWTDIRATRTLNERAAREQQDERHICPMALDIIERALQLYSNPGDVVLDPFAGIGSTGYMAIQTARKFIGCELKPAYWRQACKNLEDAKANQGLLFQA